MAHIVFAVQGGVFSEGVDYPGNMVIGAFIVGPPFSPRGDRLAFQQPANDLRHHDALDGALDLEAAMKVVRDRNGKFLHLRNCVHAVTLKK